jgi:hypothetical protein
MVARRTRRRIRGGEGSLGAPPLLVKPHGVNNNATRATEEEFNAVLAKLVNVVPPEKAAKAKQFYTAEFKNANTIPEMMSVIFDMYDVIINRIAIQYINARAPKGLVNDNAGRALKKSANMKESSLRALLETAQTALAANNSNNSVANADIAYQKLRNAIFNDRRNRVDRMHGRGRRIKHTRRRRIRGGDPFDIQLEELRARTDLTNEEEKAARDAIIEARYQARIAKNAAFAAEITAAESARNKAALNAVHNYSPPSDRRARITAAMITHPK